MQVSKINSIQKAYTPNFGEIEGDGGIYKNPLRENADTEISDFYAKLKQKKLTQKTDKMNKLLKSIEGKDLNLLEKALFNIKKFMIKI